MRPLAVIAAVAENGVIGKDNRLLWRLRADLRRFRELTWGKPMIMGRRTFESIGKPLPGRETIVLTRDPDFSASGIHRAESWGEARAIAEGLAKQAGAPWIPVVGGAEIYAQALPEADLIYLTEVHTRPEGDAHFPFPDPAEFREVRATRHPAGPDDDHPFTFRDFERRRTAILGRTPLTNVPPMPTSEP
jgi:dihydrofolate reductase